MGLQDFKITEGAISQYGVVSAPDRLIGDPQENKRVFDRLIRDVVKSMFNGLVDALLDTGAAGEIGAGVENVTGDNVQAILNSMKLLLDSKAPTAEVNAALGLKADTSVTDTHVKDVEFDADTGKFRFVKQSGSVVEFDTALEKVATNWVYDAATQSLVLTLADGSTQRVSLSDFVTLTEFASSESVEFSVSGQTVTARIKAGSVTDAMLDSTLKAMLQGYVSAANASEQSAAASAAAAAESARQAAASKAAAGTSAANAAESERQAAQSEADAETSKRAAAQSEAAAKAAQAAAEKARDEAGEIVGGDFIDRKEKGAAGGVATLDESGKVPSEQLPEMNYDPAGTAASKVSAHNSSATAHSDIRTAVSNAQSKADTADTKAANADAKAQAAMEKAKDALTVEEVRAICGDLPIGYVPLEYIESTGTQYINTGFIPNQDTRVVCDFQVTDTSSAWRCIFSARDNASNANAFALWLSTDNKFAVFYTTSGSVSYFPSTISATERQVVDMNKNVATIDGASVMQAYQSLSCNYPLYIGGANTAGTLDYPTAIKIYSCKIYDNGTLVRDFVPCKNPAGTVGLYDKVTKELYENAGSGSFVEGDEVQEGAGLDPEAAKKVLNGEGVGELWKVVQENASMEALTVEEVQTICGLPVGFKQVEHIQSSGAQYIDTEFKPTGNTRVVMDVHYTSMENSQFVFGTRNSSNSESFSLIYTSGKLRSDHNNSNAEFSNISISDRLQIDRNKNVCTINGVTVTGNVSNFTAPYSLYLCACNQAGTASYFASLKIYSCKIYDNGTLVRDYVPCVNANGEYGLCDVLSGKFYGNAGSGAFTAEGGGVASDVAEKVLNGAGLSEMWTLLGGAIPSAGAKIETGSYTGTGKYGDTNKNSLTFSITPKIVILQGASSVGDDVTVVMFSGRAAVGYMHKYDGSTAALMTLKYLNLSWDEKTISWYCSSGDVYQFNYSGRTYHYAAIG